MAARLRALPTEVTQSPDHVVVRTEMIHDARIIPLHGRPHVSPAIRQYHGDARGRWDGDTLVVDTTNFSPDSSFRGSADGLHLIEKLRRVSDDTLEYLRHHRGSDGLVASVDADDSAQEDRRADVRGRRCHEGNYGLPAILRGARAQETAARP